VTKEPFTLKYALASGIIFYARGQQPTAR